MVRMVGVTSTSTLRKHLRRERLQDRAAPAERLDVVGRRDGVAGIHPAADMRAVGLRVGAHPFGVDRRRLDAGDDAAIGGDRVHQRQGEPADGRAALGQDRQRRFHRRDDRRIGAVEKVVGRHADPQAAHVAGHARPRSPAPARARWSGRADRGRRSPSCTRAQSRAVRASGPTLSCENDSGMTP